MKGRLAELADRLFSCPTPSRGSVVDQLRRKPTHVCSLAFSDSDKLLVAADEIASAAPGELNAALDQKVQIFLHPAIRGRLKQGAAEVVIGRLLECKDVAEVRSILVPASLENPGIVDTINRYLKRIVVKRIKLADFKPALATVEEKQLTDVAAEFQSFLEAQLKSLGADEDTLPMLQFE